MKDEKQEPEFTFVDKRKISREEEKEDVKEVKETKEEARAAAPKPPEEKPAMHVVSGAGESAMSMDDAAGEQEISPEQMMEADVASLLKWFTELLYGNALLWMGLMAHPQTGRVVKDLKQAQLAIDTLDFLRGKLSDGYLNEFEKKNFQSMLSKLKLDFINQSKVF